MEPTPSQAQMPPPASVPARASGSATPEPSGSGAVRPRRSTKPSAKAMQARDASPGYENGRSSRPGQSGSGSRPQIKLKTRAAPGGGGGVGQGPKTKPYMQGYDRELDSEDDETGQGLAFEEQLILRMPEGPECERLREAVSKRQVGEDVWLKFKDSRRALFHTGDSLFSAKLVDLPSIIESHKTLDNRQFFKVADISQMLLVEDKFRDEAQASANASGKGFNIDDFIYPHGITPPMKWARKRRFRKRAPRRAIETVEKEVERLLKEDKKAEQLEYEVFDASQGLPSDFEEEEEDGDDQGRSPSASVAGAGSVADTPRPMGSDDEGTQMDDGEEMDGSQMGWDDQEGRRRERYDDDDDVDEDLAAELDAALEEESDDDRSARAGSRASDQEDLWDDDDDDGDDDDDDEDDDEDENEEEKERRVREAQLEAECREIEALVRRKQADVDGTMNLIIKNRHQQALRKLTVERDIKRGQLADLKQARRERKEANAAAAAAQEEEDAKRREQHASNEAAAAAAAPSSASNASPAKDAEAETKAPNEPRKADASMPPPSMPPARPPPTETPMQVDGQDEGNQDDLWYDGDK